MLIRKALAAYFSSWTLVFIVSFSFAAVSGGNWNAAGNYAAWASVVAVYAAGGTFLYGILVSSLLEAGARKLHVAGPLEWLLSGSLHVLFGFLFGFIVKSSLFAIMGGTAAILFFGFDRLIAALLPRLKRNTRLFLLAAPWLLFGIISGAVYVSSPQKPLFTASDAVAFATSGSGTAIEIFPKQAGAEKLQIDGYDVERETKVERTAMKEQYLIYFTERWRKGEEAGEYRLIYAVSRGTMEAKGEEGSKPPYEQVR